MCLIAALSLPALLFLACGSGDLPLDQVDPGVVPQDPSFEIVFALIQRECTPCHGGGSDNGADGKAEGYSVGRFAPVHGGFAGVEPNLETCESIVEEADNIAQVVLRENRMPPGARPRLSSEEKLIIERWIDNGTKSPCSP